MKYLRADLESARQMLAVSEAADDYVGKIQYEARIRDIAHELEKEAGHNDNLGSVAIYFEGGPVVGSHGISASFSSKMLGYFQDLVSEDTAISTVGELGGRGTLPSVDVSRLIVTGVALGSFGFTLEEATNQEQLLETTVATSIKRTLGKIQSVASEEESDFLSSLEKMDKRELVTLQKFFSTLDKEKATIRLVDEDKEISLDESGVHRGRERVDRTQIDEREEMLLCDILGILPQHRKFEGLLPHGEVIMGSVSEKAMETYDTLLAASKIQLPQRWITRFFIRKITPINRPEKLLYTLTDFVQPT